MKFLLPANYIIFPQCAVNTEHTCFILDDYAYVIANSRFEHEGKFFGEVDRKLMNQLITDNIYERVSVYDYQAVCYQDRDIKYEAIMDIVSSAGSTLIWNPLKAVWGAILAIIVSLGNVFKASVAADEKNYVPYCELMMSFCYNNDFLKFKNSNFQKPLNYKIFKFNFFIFNFPFSKHQWITPIQITSMKMM